MNWTGGQIKIVSALKRVGRSATVPNPQTQPPRERTAEHKPKLASESIDLLGLKPLEKPPRKPRKKRGRSQFTTAPPIKTDLKPVDVSEQPPANESDEENYLEFNSMAQTTIAPSKFDSEIMKQSMHFTQVTPSQHAPHSQFTSEQEDEEQEWNALFTEKQNLTMSAQASAEKAATKPTDLRDDDRDVLQSTVLFQEGDDELLPTLPQTAHVSTLEARMEALESKYLGLRMEFSFLKHDLKPVLTGTPNKRKRRNSIN